MVVNNTDVFISCELISQAVIGVSAGATESRLDNNSTHLTMSQFGVLCIDMSVSLTLTPHNTLFCPCGAVQM